MSSIHWPDVIEAAITDSTYNGRKPGAPANETLSVPRILSWSNEGTLDAEWTIRPELLNSRGELFGGYYSVLADVALSYNVMTVISDEEQFKTVDLRVSYFRPGIEGKITIECYVTNKSRSFVHNEALFKNEQGKLLAKVVATFALVPMA